jgi:hypothetical protein
MSEILWEEYIGDGVYAVYDRAGGVWLKANDHIHPIDKVYLEPNIFSTLVCFQQKCQFTFGGTP